jgi:hypothetical protein
MPPYPNSRPEPARPGVAGHWQPSAEGRAARTAQGAAIPVIQDALVRAAEARARVLEHYTTEEIIEILAAAAKAWTQPHYGPRAVTIARLAHDLSMPDAMLERGLDHIFGVVHEKSLARLVAAESDDPAAMDRSRPSPKGRPMRLLGPQLVVHNLAGNVPGLAVPPIVCSLIARSICMLRESRRQPWLTRAFLDTLALYSADLAAMVVPVAWDPGDLTTERFVFSQATRVELMGSDRTVRTIAARHRDRPVIARTTKVSVGLIPQGGDTQRWIAGFADDIVLWEGQGCLTPHVLLVESNLLRAERVARVLGIALDRLERLLPRHRRDFDSESRRRAFINEAELSAACVPGRLLLRGRDDAWLIHCNPEARLAAGPGLRCVTVRAVPDREAAMQALAEARHPLAAIGLAMDPQHRAFRPTATALSRTGATLVCTPGRMQRPPISWPQDGRRRLRDLLDWREESQL